MGFRCKVAYTAAGTHYNDVAFAFTDNPPDVTTDLHEMTVPVETCDAVSAASDIEGTAFSDLSTYFAFIYHLGETTARYLTRVKFPTTKARFVTILRWSIPLKINRILSQTKICCTMAGSPLSLFRLIE